MLSLIMATVLASVLSTSIVIDYEKPLSALSSDKEYRFEITPPDFKEKELSYQFFQEESFLKLLVMEGAARTKVAAVTGSLFQKRADHYELVWTRPLVSSKIPNRLIVLSTNIHMVAVALGERKTLPSFSTYFSIYDIDGRCLTNGSYPNSKTNTWWFDGEKVELVDEKVHVVAYPLPE
jgi:hypothetical protein